MNVRFKCLCLQVVLLFQLLHPYLAGLLELSHRLEQLNARLIRLETLILNLHDVVRGRLDVRLQLNLFG